MKNRFVSTALAALLILSTMLPSRAEDVTNLRSKALPDHPKRIVALDFLPAESLAALDITPVGVADKQTYAEWIGDEALRLSSSIDIGTRQQPDLEAIARLKPDLIIGMAYRHATLFNALQRIAPTVLYEFSPRNFQTSQFDQALKTFDDIATISDRKSQGTEIKKQLFMQLTEEQKRLEAAGLAGKTIILIQELGLPERYWNFTGNSMAGGLAHALGLSIWPTAPTREGTDYLNTEQLLSRPAQDTLILIGMNDTAGKKQIFSSQVWQHIPLRQADHAQGIARNIWGFGGPISAGRLAHAITQTMLDTHPR